MDYKAELEKLNQKISQIRKNISYLDLYNITDACEDPQNFAAQTNSLLPNSSLVINCDGFYFNNDRYETGDLVLKMANSKIIHIKAQTGGIFYPSSVEVLDSNLNLTFTFSSSQPLEEKSTDGSLAKEMKFSGLTVDQKTNIYGLWQPVTESFAVCFYNNQPIEPYIKFYLVDEDTVEEICLDYTLTLKVKDEIQSYEVEIDPNLQTSTIYMKVK